MTEAERIGLLKRFSRVEKLIDYSSNLNTSQKDLGINIDIENIPFDDQKCLNCCRKEIQLAYSN